MIKIGQELGNFLIKAEIGRGGMGTIYYAVDTMLNREVALKLIHPQLAGQAELMERFKIEAMTQARMNHPNIVMIFSFSRIEDNYVIAMEYVDGKSLKELLQEKKMIPLSEAIDYLRQILEALNYAHSLQVIHRDIKPANIMVSREGRIKISDFGIAKVFGSQGLTKTGMLIGTPWYTSPEQILGRNIDFRSDLYSLGITFYEMVTGRVPFHDETNSDFQIQKAHLETPPPRPSIFNPEIDLQLEKFILRSLEKKVEKRFANAREMVEDLTELKTAVTAATMVTSAAKASYGGKPGIFWIRLGLGGMALVLCLLLVWFFLLKPQPADLPGFVTETVDPVPETAFQEKEIIDSTGEKAWLLPEQVTASEENKLLIPEIEKEKQEIEPIVKEKPQDLLLAPPVKEESRAPTLSEKEEIKSETKPQVRRLTPAQVNQEMLRFRNLVNRKDWAAANELGQQLLAASRTAVLLSELGVVKLFRGEYQVARLLWREALDKKENIQIPIHHLLEPGNTTFSGRLIMKKGLIVFNSQSEPTHSFVWEAVHPGRMQINTEAGPGLVFEFSQEGVLIKRRLVFSGAPPNRERDDFLASFIRNNIL